MTPSFGQGDYIEETIQSVLHQRYPKVEHIVIDGGSKDQTVSILEQYSAHFAYWVSEPDRGQTHALNKGLERVTGDLVLVLNSDDTLLPGAFDYVAKQFREQPSMRWMTAPSLYFGEGMKEDFTPVIIPKTRAEWFVKHAISHPSTFLRREVYEQYGPYDDSLFFSMDYDYWLRLAMHNEVCHFRSRPLSTFRLHADCKSMTFQERRDADNKTLFAKYSPMLSEAERAGLEERVRRFRLSEEIWACQEDLRRGDSLAARSRLDAVVKAHPEARKLKAFYTTWLRIALNKPS